MSEPALMRRSVFIRETRCDGAIVITGRLRQRYLLQPYRTRVVDHGVETCVGFFRSQAAANQWHETAVKSLSHNSEKGTTNAKGGL